MNLADPISDEDIQYRPTWVLSKMRIIPDDPVLIGRSKEDQARIQTRWISWKDHHLSQKRSIRKASNLKNEWPQKIKYEQGPFIRKEWRPFTVFGFRREAIVKFSTLNQICVRLIRSGFNKISVGRFIKTCHGVRTEINLAYDSAESPRKSLRIICVRI